MLNNELWQKPTSGAAAFYSHQIEQSARFDKGSSSSLTKTWGGNATDGTKATFSVWLKRGELGGTYDIISADDSSNFTMLEFMTNSASDQLYFQLGRESNASSPQAAITNAQYRDTGGFMNIVYAVDASETGADQQKLYMNGTRLTSFSADTLAARAMSGSDTWAITRNGRTAQIGKKASTNYFDGYMAEIVCIDGTDYGADSFGETKNGVWIPKDPSGLTFGNNGFYLKFQNASALGDDSSGNNNDFTANNMGADHQVLDSPTFGS